MKLTIKGLSMGDFGNYRCISKNSLGETEGSIRVYGKCGIHGDEERAGMLSCCGKARHCHTDSLLMGCQFGLNPSSRANELFHAKSLTTRNRISNYK